MPVIRKRVEIRLEEKEYDKIKEMAKKEGKPIARVVREAIETLYEKLATEEKKKAVQKLAAMHVDLPEWCKLEEEIEGKYED
jgi:predicted DNA-binding protein